MATRKGRRRSKLNRIVAVLVTAVVLFCVGSSYLDKNGLDADFGRPDLSSASAFLDWLEEQLPESSGSAAENKVPAGNLPDARLEVHYLDMGQADSILIRGPDKTVLIDAGENNQGDQVLRYLRELGVGKIDLAIGTHPHSDHIGGLDTVLLGIAVEEIVLPVIPEEITPTTVTYTDLLTAIARQGVSLTPARPGKSYDLGDGAVLTLLGPTAEFSDLNNLSVVSRLVYGGVSFLFTGDIEKAAEEDLLLSGQKLSATVMDAGHHGSNTSSTQSFLNAVRPQVVVMSCGLDNSYGHPHREVVERYQAMGAQIFRTDLHGAVVLRTDGEALDIATEH